MFRMLILGCLLLSCSGGAASWNDPPAAEVRPGTPPVLIELSPAPAPAPPKVDLKPADPVPLAVDRYRFFKIDDYVGPVTWEIKGDAVGMKEVVKPFALFGRIHGLPDPGEYDVPAGAVVVWGRHAGTATLRADGVVNGKAKHLLTKTFVVGDGGSTPVTPVTPDVKPPVSSELTKKFQAAYAKAPDAAALAGLVAAMADAVTACNDGSLLDAGALEAKVRSATIAKIGRGKLVAVGQAIADHLADKLPAEPTAPLTAEIRAAAATAYGDVVTALKEVK